MDAISIRATMTKTEDPCIPQAHESVISFAAQFFAPDYAPKMNPSEWRVEQEKDPAIRKLVKLIENEALFTY